MGEGGGGGSDAGDGSAAHVCNGDAAVAGSWGGEVNSVCYSPDGKSDPTGS